MNINNVLFVSDLAVSLPCVVCPCVSVVGLLS